MSTSASAWVWANSQAKGTARLVLLALADQADDSGRCYPSVSYIAQKCRIAERTTQDALQHLESLGELARDLRVGRSTVYRLVMPPAVGGADSAGVGGADSAGVSQTGDAPSRTPGCGSPHPETSLNPSTSPESVVTSTRKRAPAARGTRMTEDWQPSVEVIDWCRTNAPDVGWADVEEFRDYWMAESGARARKLDWQRTWKNRARELQSRRNRTANGRHPASRKPTMDDVIAENSRRYEEMRRKEMESEQLTLGGTS